MYEYENGSRLFSNTRQQAGCKNEISAIALGQRGRAVISEGGMRITGENAWEEKGRDNPFYQTEHDELFASIRKGVPINNGEYMAKSSLLAIMGRMAAYTGKEITWEQAMNSKEDLSPPRYAWDQPIQDPPIAIPGQTKFH
jgi:hypothetical protein